MRLLIVLAVACLFASGAPVPSKAASSDILISAVPSNVCLGSSFKVGVMYRAWAGGTNHYSIEIYNPSHRLVFYRVGKALNLKWKEWRITPATSGRYKTIYSGPNFSQRYTTMVAGC